LEEKMMKYKQTIKEREKIIHELEKKSLELDKVTNIVIKYRDVIPLN
jgi:exonuclease VII small subunit